MILNLLDVDNTLYEIEIEIEEIGGYDIPYALIQQIEKDLDIDVVDYWINKE
ncbi:MAG: hypothetical protein QXW48_03935 [Thermoplasmata archaeon]